MSSGRRDYTWGFLHESSPEGRFVNRWGGIISQEVLAGATTEVYSYELTAGYKRTINYFSIAGGQGVGNSLQVRINGQYAFFHVFGSNDTIILPDHNIISWVKGETLQIKIYNADTVDVMFYGYVMGITETLL